MKNEKLFYAIGEIEDTFILEAEKQNLDLEQSTDKKESEREKGQIFHAWKKRKKWLKWGVAAACFTLMVCSIYVVSRSDITKNPSEELPNLPMLTLSDTIEDVEMGFEGYWAYDSAELVNANPWSEDLEIDTLPVYQNPLTYNANFVTDGEDFEQMQAFLLEIAERFGVDSDTLVITDDAKSQEKLGKELGFPEGYFHPTKLIAETDGIRIEVEQTMMATIIFEPCIFLPDEYQFTTYASYEELSVVADYLRTEYKDIIGLDYPQINISGGDYDICAKQSYLIQFFDGAGTKEEQILQYNFNPITFYCNDEGKLYMIRIYQPDLSQKVGDYPIITQKEAEQLLLEGQYLTSVPYEVQGIESIKKVELIYRTGLQLEQYYMPYYRFYVELPEEEIDGMKCYGTYYVPAVNQAYIRWETNHASINGE